MNRLMEKLDAGRKLAGTYVTLADPSICDIAGRAGYDFLWIDAEHSCLSPKEVFVHIMAAQANGTAAVVRVPQNDLTFTKKILEMGSDGIIFPMVHNAQEAEKLVSMCLFPPNGNRGFGPIRAVEYGNADAVEYVRTGHRNTLIWIQIETARIVEELNVLAENPFIDGFIVGPNDLAGSVGRTADVFSEETSKLIRRAVDIVHAGGKYIGLSTGADDVQTVRHWATFGFDILSAGADFDFIRTKNFRFGILSNGQGTE